MCPLSQWIQICCCMSSLYINAPNATLSEFLPTWLNSSHLQEFCSGLIPQVSPGKCVAPCWLHPPFTGKAWCCPAQIPHWVLRLVTRESSCHIIITFTWRVSFLYLFNVAICKSPFKGGKEWFCPVHILTQTNPELLLNSKELKKINTPSSHVSISGNTHGQSAKVDLLLVSVLSYTWNHLLP